MTPASRHLPAWVLWPLGYVALVGLAALVGWLSIGVGNAMFVAGGLVILASVGFVGMGGESRFRIIRNLFGQPVAIEPQDREKRLREISTGVKVFLLGLAIWAPLIYIAVRG